jgi:hypothetical protein
MSGIDYDLEACLIYNPQGFGIDDIKSVLAVWEGENDGDDWRWVLLMKDGRYIFLQGGCDYTGWDCQSWASHKVVDSPEEGAKLAIKSDVSIENSSPVDAGLGHMLNILSGDYNANGNEVYESLMKQIAEGKNKTWHESKSDEFGNPPMIDPNNIEGKR